MSEVHAGGCANRQITPIRSKWFRLQDQTFYQQEKEKKRNKWSRNSQRNTGAGAKMTFLKYQHIILVSPDSTVLEECLTLLSTCRMLPSRCFCGISELWQPAYPPPNTSTTWLSWMFCYAYQLMRLWFSYLSIRKLLRPSSITVRLSYGTEPHQRSPLRVLCGLHVTASGPVANA